MRRTLPIAAVMLALAACTAGPETQRSALPPPLPDKVTSLPYGALLERARAQATKATEVSLLDDWAGLEEAARALEQTAKYLAKADDVPAKHKDTYVTTAGDLGKLADELRQAAAAKDAKKATEALTKINTKVREMRLAD